MTSARAKERAPRGTMPLGGHLRELTRRLGVAGTAFVAAAVAGWVLADRVWESLRLPVAAVADHGREAAINYPTITGAFDVHLQTALTIALVLSSPVWLYQIFAFVLPGLHRREQAYSLGFVGAAVPLFVGGCFAGWLVVPHIVELMAGFAPADTAAFYEARGYLDFVLKLMIVTGIAFVLPLFVVLLNFAGVLRGTTVLHSWRLVILGICVFTAVATPAADVLSMFLLAIPMVVLFASAVSIALLHDRAIDKREARMLTEVA